MLFHDPVPPLREGDISPGLILDVPDRLLPPRNRTCVAAVLSFRYGWGGS